MRPVSGVMLAVAAALTSPALAGAVMGSVPVEVALVRYLVVAGVCWLLLTFASDWLWSPTTDDATVQGAPVALAVEDDPVDRPPAP